MTEATVSYPEEDDSGYYDPEEIDFPTVDTDAPFDSWEDGSIAGL